MYLRSVKMKVCFTPLAVQVKSKTQTTKNVCLVKKGAWHAAWVCKLPFCLELKQLCPFSHILIPSFLQQGLLSLLSSLSPSTSIKQAHSHANRVAVKDAPSGGNG